MEQNDQEREQIKQVIVSMLKDQSKYADKLPPSGPAFISRSSLKNDILPVITTDEELLDKIFDELVNEGKITVITDDKQGVCYQYAFHVSDQIKKQIKEKEEEEKGMDETTEKTDARPHPETNMLDTLKAAIQNASRSNYAVTRLLGQYLEEYSLKIPDTLDGKILQRISHRLGSDAVMCLLRNNSALIEIDELLSQDEDERRFTATVHGGKTLVETEKDRNERRNEQMAASEKR